MRKLNLIWVVLCLCAWLAGNARGETFVLNDGQTLSGEVVSYDENGLVLRLPAENKYSDRVPWANFSQADLKKLAENSKIAPLVEPYIEVSQERRPDVQIQPVTRLHRPAPHTLLGALLSSSVGVFILLLLYAANLFAAFEISIFRARPVALVCGVSAVLPLIGPILFLVIPTAREEIEEVDAPPHAPAVIQPFAHRPPGSPAPASTASGKAAAEAEQPGGVRVAATEAGPASGAIPQTQIFKRGATTFNRRFFETKFPGFFGIVRREADKDFALVIQAARGQYTAQRISRIAANELHVHVQKGAASEEIMIPFTEIQEVQLRHIKA